MLPLSQPEINEYRRAFRQFPNRLDDDNVLITMHDMAKLLGELGKTHSETDAKTLFNELEIAADGTGWILDLPTFMVLMLHKGNRKANRGKKVNCKQSTTQWKELISQGTLPSTEILVSEEYDIEEIEAERYRNKSFPRSEYVRCIQYPNLQNEYGVEFPPSECQLHPYDECSPSTDLNSDEAKSSVLFKDDRLSLQQPGVCASVADHEIATKNRKTCCIL